ncbi:MAG: hypothetical protein JNK02_15535 [Planctomycetes bacterium]|nr:hypothetical protein [Planctomycetota bacterium]
MIAELALALAASRPDLERAVALAREGRFVEALAAAEAEPDTVRRAQAVFHVRHHAGDLDGALRTAALARTEGATSPWLEEREAYAALSVRDAAHARAALEALDARPDRGGEALASTARALWDELGALERALSARDAAARRAWGVAAAGLVALTVGAVLLTLTGDRGRRSP